jgi:hypothetical protein
MTVANRIIKQSSCVGILYLSLAIGVQSFNKATYQIVTWSDKCVTTFPDANLALRNKDAIALWHATPMLVNIWNNELLYEAAQSSSNILQSILPMALGDFRECVIECNAFEEPRTGYFDTMLGTGRYGLLDAYNLMNICFAKTYNNSVVASTIMDASHLKVILNAPLVFNAGFNWGSSIHISNLIMPTEKPMTPMSIRVWLSVLLHEAFHGLGIGHARAPRAGTSSDMENEYGMFGDVMGTWVDEGVGKTRFLNGAHLLALGFAIPVHVVTLTNPVTLVATSDFQLQMTSPTKPANSSTIIAVVDTKEGQLVFDVVVLNNNVVNIPFGVSGAIVPGQVYIRVIASPKPNQHSLPPVDLVAMIPINSSSTECVNLQEWKAPSPNGTYVRGQPPAWHWNSAWTVVFMAHVCGRLISNDYVNMTVSQL